MILVVAEPLLGQKVEFPALYAKQKVQTAAQPVMDQVEEQYEYYIRQALEQEIEGEGIEIDEVRCLLGTDGFCSRSRSSVPRRKAARGLSCGLIKRRRNRKQRSYRSVFRGFWRQM